MEKPEINYDALPVAACKYCKSLNIVIDNLENDNCGRCGSVNEVLVFANIQEYLQWKNGK